MHLHNKKVINKAVTVVVSKLNDEIKVLQDKLKLLITIVKSRHIKLNNFEEAQHVYKNIQVEPRKENQNEPEVTVELERMNSLEKGPEPT